MSRAWVCGQVDVAAARLRDSVVSTAESDLTSQAYWLSATLALGAFLKVCFPSPHPLVLPCSLALMTLLSDELAIDGGHLNICIAMLPSLPCSMMSW